MILPKVPVYLKILVDKTSTDTFDYMDVFRDKFIRVWVILRDKFKGFKYLSIAAWTMMETYGMADWTGTSLSMATIATKFWWSPAA